MLKAPVSGSRTWMCTTAAPAWAAEIAALAICSGVTAQCGLFVTLVSSPVTAQVIMTSEFIRRSSNAAYRLPFNIIASIIYYYSRAEGSSVPAHHSASIPYRRSPGRRPAPGQRALMLALTCLLALALGACGRAGGVPAAGPRLLYIYTWADYIGHDTIADFERATGIKVVYDTYDSDETLEAKMMAGDSGYDIVSTSTNYFGRQIKAGIYAPLDRSLLPNWDNLDPHFLAAEAEADPGNRHAMPYLHAING